MKLAEGIRQVLATLHVTDWGEFQEGDTESYYRMGVVHYAAKTTAGRTLQSCR